MPKHQSNIFRDLAMLCDAGISIHAAAQKVSASHPDQTAWPTVIEKLAKGRSLCDALSKSGLVTHYELEIISVAEHAGRLPQGLTNIALSYDQRSSRISRLKSKLYYPFALLTVGIIVSTILQIANTATESNVAIIIRSFVWFAIAIMVTKLLFNFMQKEACYWLNAVSNYDNRSWYKMQFQQVVFGALLWQNQSGVDFKTGFSRITKLINSKDIQKKLSMASRLCGNGMSVSASVREANLPVTDDFYQILLTGEQSGTWNSSVEKYLIINRQQLDLIIDNFFEWAPRMYYALMVVFVILVIV